uniref:Uncharacterized protein n=1 Tax=viral metagenome TaxID=1070528 RepID=A0A6C0JAG6_9ZZZZ
MIDILHYILFCCVFLTMFVCCRVLVECGKLGCYICGNSCCNKKKNIPMETSLIP